jgi:Xaa-Pro aminopeptidase
MTGRTDEILLVGNCLHTPELRLAVPLPIGDTLIYAEQGDSTYVAVPAGEADAIQELELGHEVLTFDLLGVRDLYARGWDLERIEPELVLRLCRRIGLTAAAVPAAFPLREADFLRAEGLALRVDQALFDARRRVKGSLQLAGIERALRASEAALDDVVSMLYRAEIRAGFLHLGGRRLTCELLKTQIYRRLSEHESVADELIVSHGPQTASGAHMGSGPIRSGEPILVDIYPRDRTTGCYSDLTRTFLVGPCPSRIAESHELVLEALELAKRMISPGTEGGEVHRAVCELFSRHGFRSQLYPDGDPGRAGFFHATGHGVGLNLHERPNLGLLSDPLISGDVVAIEPGLYCEGVSGVRVEDLVQVTDSGCRALSHYPHDLLVAGADARARRCDEPVWPPDGHPPCRNDVPQSPRSH